MNWLLVILFEVCAPNGQCGHEQFLAEMSAERCLVDKAAFAAGRSDASTIRFEDDNSGVTYPVVAVDCVPPVEAEMCEPGDGPDQTIISAYPQEPQ